MRLNALPIETVAAHIGHAAPRGPERTPFFRAPVRPHALPSRVWLSVLVDNERYTGEPQMAIG